MKIRKSTQKDVLSIMTLVHQAQAYFKTNGIDQWQDGYPQMQNIEDDIQRQKSYVLEDQKILGTMYFAIEDDPHYDSIQGRWLTHQQKYAVIHRIVVDENVKGQRLANQLLEFAIDKCNQAKIQSIRIDTHKDNLSMQRFLLRNGFKECGIVTLESGALRIGFEKIMNK